MIFTIEDEETDDSELSDDHLSDNYESDNIESDNDDSDSDYQAFKLDTEAMASRRYVLSSEDETDSETVAYDDEDHCSNDGEQNHESDE